MKEYILTKSIETRILQYSGIRCHKCNKRIYIGEKIVSNAKGTCNSKYYHTRCFKRV